MSGKEQYDVLFAVIAPREVEFFANVADVLVGEHGLKCAFMTFYEPGDRYLAKRGYRVFSLHKEVDAHAVDVSANAARQIASRYGIQNVRDLLLHEKLTFNRFDEDKLLSKLIKYDRYFARLLESCEISGVVQELGGFIAPLSLCYNCRAYHVRHIFIEPSMYKGRLCYNVDSINNELSRVGDYDEQVRQEVRQYIEDYHQNKPIVIPIKDKHHFVWGLRKLINKRNIGCLCRKTYHKYVRREKEEYDAIYNHIKRHVGMCVRRLVMRRLYSRPDYGEEYIYYPLHSPIDFQLTVRETRYLNQIALAEYIANVLPYGVHLYIKEHPASIGGYNYSRVSRLLKNRNVKLINPAVNSYDLVERSLCVITINSKVGVEALMQGKKVMVLGEPPYAQAKAAVRVEDNSKLGEYISACKTDCGGEVDYDFFCRVYFNSFKGELYQDLASNVSNVAASLQEHLNLKGREVRESRSESDILV